MKRKEGNEMAGFMENLERILRGAEDKGEKIIFPVGGKLTIPEMNGALDRSIVEVDLNSRGRSCLLRAGLYPKIAKGEKPEDFTVRRVVDTPFEKILSFKGCGIDTAKAIKTSILEYMYDSLTLDQKKKFWCDFVALNSPEVWEQATGIKVALG
jgi:hypothetical protein